MFNENLHSQAVERVWNPLPQSMNHRISTLKLGIIGLGRIGGAVAQRLRVFGVQIYFYDPYLPDGYDQVFAATRVNELKELFKLCDVVSIHTPLTHETEGMITLDLLRVAKKRMIVINCARGKILRNHTIVEALKQNLVEAFILDTIEEEPIKIGEELYSIANHDEYRHRLLITPHAASYDIESRCDREQLALSLKTARGLLDKIEDNIVKGRIDKAVSRFIKVDDEMSDLTHRYLKIDSATIEGFAQQIFTGAVNILDIEMPIECRRAIESYLCVLQNIAVTRQATFAEINGLKDKHLMSYWAARLCDLILIIRREHSELIPEEIKSRIADNIGDLQAKHDELENCLVVRNQLYDIYNKSYYRYFEESAL